MRARRIEGELEEDILYDVLQSSCHAAQPLVGLDGLTVVGQVQLGYWWVGGWAMKRGMSAMAPDSRRGCTMADQGTHTWPHKLGQFVGGGCTNQ